MIRDNILRIRAEIDSLCQKCGRSSLEITLVGITKYATGPQIVEALDAGLTHIGENKVQQAKEKFPLLQERQEDVVRHMVGHLQTNKCKDALALFDMIDSIDSVKLAREVSKQALKLDREVDCLMEMNISGEEQKHGFSPEEIDQAIEDILALENVHIKGLMTMAPMTDDEALIRPVFNKLKATFDALQSRYKDQDKITMQHLSMGMTGDYKIAIEEGSNMIRIGRAIFNSD